MRLYSIILVSFLLLSGCITSPVYQKTYSVPQNSWSYDFQPSFKFEVTDTTVLYNLFFVVRHTDNYPYSNIWLNVYTKQPGDTAFSKTRIEVTLASPTGQWLGRGMGELWEQRMLLNTPGDRSILHKPGKYEIKLEQNMRLNPLPEVLQAGLRIEKDGNRNNPQHS
ncbi:gliding motility lipoprotein GldH [Chitinophagaceae bacterium MMS25-I14]